MKEVSVMILFLCFAHTATSQQNVCFYGSRAFASDLTFQTHGATCQQCSAQAGGSWIDKLQGCEKFNEKEVPGAQPPSQVCSDTDGLIYSEGAIFDNGSQCKRCQNKQWFELDRKAFCKH
jgi:hypothetical protein